MFLGILVLVVVVAVPVIMHIIPGPKISVPVPPGWQAVSGQTLEEFKKEAEEYGITDYFFSSSAYGSAMIVYHGRYSDAPPETENMTEMERYQNSNEADFNAMFFMGSGKDQDATVTAMDTTVDKLACGNATLRFSGVLAQPGTGFLQCDALFFTKGGTSFMAIVYKPAGSDCTTEIEFLKENISFR